ncbi:hypothetical protein F4859DRAFT_487470 [Xylaria cf. heliscus]|nr:hypothetical protein F4859DRAFT_487470 [Xylaria cf. heliscus]
MRPLRRSHTLASLGSSVPFLPLANLYNPSYPQNNIDSLLLHSCSQHNHPLLLHSSSQHHYSIVHTCRVNSAIMDNIFERHIPFHRLKEPRALLQSLDIVCKTKNLELVSVELRNDIYVMRFRRVRKQFIESIMFKH